jgi:hypothetical protein
LLQEVLRLGEQISPDKVARGLPLIFLVRAQLTQVAGVAAGQALRDRGAWVELEAGVLAGLSPVQRQLLEQPTQAVAAVVHGFLTAVGGLVLQAVQA